MGVRTQYLERCDRCGFVYNPRYGRVGDFTVEVNEHGWEEHDGGEIEEVLVGSEHTTYHLCAVCCMDFGHWVDDGRKVE